MIDSTALDKCDVGQLYDKFRLACNIDSDLSIVEWLCAKTTLNGQPFSFAGYEYLIGPVEDLHPRQVMIKPAQRGASEVMARKMFAILYRYGLTPHYYEEAGEERCVWGIAGIYSFPDFDSLRKFSKDRIVTDIVKASTVLADAGKNSASESLDQIGIFDSFLYMIGRKSDSSNQSVPAEIIMVDEADRPLNGDKRIRTALNARVGNARVFKNDFYRGLITDYGTPTFPDEEGILLDGKYFLSDQMTWMVKCHRCNHWQEIKYPESIAHYYEKGQKPEKKDPYWMCLSCKRPLDFSQIGRWKPTQPKKILNAEWVPKFPERTKNGEGIRGWRIPFATVRDTAKSVLITRDTDLKASMADFYNFGLGFAYRDNAIGLGEEDFTRRRHDHVKWGTVNDMQSYVMGVDQGMYMVVAGLKPDSQTDLNPHGIWQTVWCQHIKDSKAFSKIVRNEVSGELYIERGEFAKAVDYWNPEVIVMDHLPNTASAEAEAAIFKETMWLCDSKGNAGMARLRIEEIDSEGNIVHRVTEQKHLELDEYFTQIRGGRWEFPLETDGEEFDFFRAHHKAIKKIINENGTFTYESFGDDHYGQAGKLCSEAVELFNIVKPRVKTSGILLITGFQSKRPN
jgi:hypothetical protein